MDNFTQHNGKLDAPIYRPSLLDKSQAKPDFVEAF